MYISNRYTAFKMETEKRVNEIKESFEGLLTKFEGSNKTFNPHMVNCVTLV